MNTYQSQLVEHKLAEQMPASEDRIISLCAVECECGAQFRAISIDPDLEEQVHCPGCGRALEIARHLVSKKEYRERDVIHILRGMEQNTR